MQIRNKLAAAFLLLFCAAAHADGIINGGGGGGAPTGAAGGSLAGTYPNPTLAMDTAWTTFTPTITCGTATFTTTSARSKTEGKTTWISLDFTFTAIGSCANALTFTAPNTPQSGAALAATAISIAGACQVLPASTSVTCANAAASVFINGQHWTVSGVYENQ